MEQWKGCWGYEDFVSFVDEAFTPGAEPKEQHEFVFHTEYFSVDHEGVYRANPFGKKGARQEWAHVKLGPEGVLPGSVSSILNH